MADPISMTAVMAGVGMAAGAAGAVTGAIGSSYQGEATGNMYQYQAGVAQLNKKIASQNADYARYAGEVDAQREGMKTRFTVGTTKATQAASGIDVDSGSAADVRGSEQAIGEQDMGMIRANAARKAYAYEVEGVSKETESQLDLMAARKSRTAGKLGVASSLIGGASSVAGKWLDASKSGVFGGSGSPTAASSTSWQAGD